MIAFHLHQFVELKDIQVIANYILPVAMLNKWHRKQASLNKAGVVNSKLLEDLQTTVRRASRKSTADLTLNFESDDDELDRSMASYEVLRNNADEKAEELFLTFFEFLFEIHHQIEEMAFTEANDVELL